MLIKDFYIRVASSEQACTAFLREHQLLIDVNNIDPCHKCGTEMREKRRKNRMVNLCLYSGAQKKVVKLICGCDLYLNIDIYIIHKNRRLNWLKRNLYVDVIYI